MEKIVYLFLSFIVFIFEISMKIILCLLEVIPPLLFLAICLSPIALVVYCSYAPPVLFNWEFNKGEKNLPKMVPLYRDIPFNGDIYKFYFLVYLYSLNNNRNSRIDLLGGILLKWSKEKKIDIIETQSSGQEKKKIIIKFKDGFISDYEFEMNLYNMLYGASKDGILEYSEFDNWCGRNSARILSCFNDVIRYETNDLVNNGQIEIRRVFNKEKHYIKTSLYEDGKIVKGVKNFLLEFSEIDSRKAVEVVNWEEYLIMAQMLGIADKVEKQFKKIYPDVIVYHESNYNRMSFDEINIASPVSEPHSNSSGEGEDAC